MSLWEYKVISSGKGGFATPALLEKFLNDLGREEWEIVDFRTPPDNPLAFSGLARRPTQRDWTLEDAAAAAAKAEADKLRAEFEAKFKAATGAAQPEAAAPSFIEEKLAPEDGFRKPVDTSHDADPDADDESEKDDWDQLTAAEEDELPTFFEAIKPHMRRNQRGPGMSVGVDYLAKKWDQSEDDIKGALVECGFEVPADEDAKAVYVEYDGDLYWINVNRRGELWINTKEKPRPMFRAVKAQRASVEEEPRPESPKPENRRPKADEPAARAEEKVPDRPAEPAERTLSLEAAPAMAETKSNRPASGAPLPEGPALLDRIRPHMRRNRRGPGGSGSTNFLSRALKCQEADLKSAFAALGLVVPASPNDKPTLVEIGNEVWWLNIDSRGGLWINGRQKKDGESVGAGRAEETTVPAEPVVTAPPRVTSPEGPTRILEATSAEPVRELAPEAGITADAPASPATDLLGSLRPLLKETKTGAIAARIDRIAEETTQSGDALLASLVAAGLKVPEKPREKPVFVERAGEIFWINRNAKGELWLNAKASKFPAKTAATDEAGAAGGEEKKPRRPRSRKKTDSGNSPEA
jgi:hypothetical protein